MASVRALLKGVSGHHQSLQCLPSLNILVSPPQLLECPLLHVTPSIWTPRARTSCHQERGQRLLGEPSQAHRKCLTLPGKRDLASQSKTQLGRQWATRTFPDFMALRSQGRDRLDWPDRHLDFGLPPNCERIHFCYFKPLSLWSSVTAILGITNTVFQGRG